MLNKLKAKYKSQRPENQQRIMIAGIFGVAALIMTLVYFTSPSSKESPVKISAVDPSQTLSLDNKMLEKSVTAKTGELERQLAEQQKLIEALKSGQPLPGGDVAAGSPQSAFDKNLQAALQPEQPLPVPPPPAPSRGVSALPPVPSGAPAYDGEGPAPVPHTPVVELIGGIGTVEGKQEVVAESSSKGAAAGKKKESGPRTAYLPPSFMEAHLLSGLNAPTTEGARGNPVPVLLRIQAPAVLPNEVRANLRGCFVIAEGVGNLADERAHLRLVSISCLSKKGQAVVDQEITGFVQDRDGKIGLAGRVVSKMGSAIARAMVGGFFGGIGQAMQQAGSTSNLTALGTTTTIGTDLKDIGIVAAGGALSNAAKDIQKFYLELARQTMPVIEVGVKDKITLIVSKGVQLDIKNNKSVSWY